MIKNVQLGKEIEVTVVNKIGVLADMAKILAGHGINVDAVVGYAVGKEAKIVIVTQDNLRATDALRKSGYNSIKENEVLVVELENKPGALKDITARLLSEEIDIMQVYGTASSEGSPAKIIIATADNEKVLVSLKR